ncbi:hypothetical protein BRM3_01980 [Brachybacterium huguangmaarense]|uniref:ESAT-6 protein secretion system EspG family protein n=1 Tax=Brachybacterium huguangmaarense TaxID=1652028 RepID=A0ABY6G2M7_9MICO|nr:hypothetical protein [Brachybacterium huguangmaarense]UYG17229.1 hypothetical protein BRM3_01980 [Brachybacterium huguangmaarense]
MDTAAPASADRTLYTAYELDFMLSLRPSAAGDMTREQLGLQGAPDEAAEYVTAAVTSGLQARGKVDHAPDGHWALGEEAQVIGTALTAADRWLGFALAEGRAMRMAFVVKAGAAVLMLVQDELDTFAVSAIDDPQDVPRSVATIARSFLSDGPGRTVSLRRTDALDPARTAAAMLHVEDDGAWQVGHEPVTDEGVLTVSPLRPDRIETVIDRLWSEGVSTGEPAALTEG